MLLGAPLLALAGTWQPLTNQPLLPNTVNPATGDFGPGGATAPLLLTDGSVIIRNSGYYNTAEVFKLTPDSSGSYVNGTWSQLASMPYMPYAGASAVLPDGRVIFEGGEYSGAPYNFLLTNEGAIYDPETDSWTSVPPPPFFVDLYPPRATFAPSPIGDAASIVLADGTYMVEDKMSRQAALLDLDTLTWTETGTATKADMNDEEGLTLLPDGKVLTIDCYTDAYFGLGSYPDDPTSSELYDPATGEWTSAGSTINTLTDPILAEIGPAVLRPDRTVFAVGSQGYTSIYNTRTHMWSVGPHLPISPQGYQYTDQDGPAALLPNGNVLFDASGGSALHGYSNPPVAFFEFNGKQLIPEPTIPNGAYDISQSINLLLLPTGQVLAVDGSGDVEIYTPDDNSYNPSWAPVVTKAPRNVSPGGSYTLRGVRLNGMSQASAFGDEDQNATNYPLVRITNLSTGHVFYSRTHDHSSMAVASDRQSTTHFDVSANQETGPSELEVVANGTPSRPVHVMVQ